MYAGVCEGRDDGKDTADAPKRSLVTVRLQQQRGIFHIRAAADSLFNRITNRTTIPFILVPQRYQLQLLFCQITLLPLRHYFRPLLPFQLRSLSRRVLFVRYLRERRLRGRDREN